MSRDKYTVGDMRTMGLTSMERTRTGSPRDEFGNLIFQNLPFIRTDSTLLLPISEYSYDNVTFLPRYISIVEVGGGIIHDDIVYPELDALDRLVNKWKGSDIDVGTYLSPEGLQTISMLKSAMSTMLFAFRGNPRRATESLEDFVGTLKKSGKPYRLLAKRTFRRVHATVVRTAHLAKEGVLKPDQLWFQTWFGWAPLLNDINAVHSENVEEVVKTTDDMIARKVQQLKSTAKAINKTGVRLQVPDVWGLDIKVSGRAYKSVKYVVHIDRTNVTWKEKYSLNNPLAVAWENVPFSFVVDWMFPIGKILNIGVYANMMNVTGVKKLKYFYEFKTSEGFGVWNNPYVVGYEKWPACEGSFTRYERKPVTGISGGDIFNAITQVKPKLPVTHLGEWRRIGHILFLLKQMAS